ncbi:MAG: filamentous hemagglutinin N-terminal domain-containing protein, partial [Verrucomicrobia bacterium]|nr:filamentous hemagglutinin N-terminal domain-containing protein [Verrucomicrobiota bacterium]
MKTYGVPSHSLSSFTLLSALFLSSPAQANPIGEQVTAGSVSFDRLYPGVLSIRQSTERAIINWQDFSISASELTRFIQPGANASTLNRVLGGNPSSIYGNLQANGQLILLNPAGILVGPGAHVDTKGFIASTLNLSDESFLSQAKLSLSGRSDKAVRNAGVIRGGSGSVYLVARDVQNAGTIKALSAGLLGSTEVVLATDGSDVGVLYGSGRVFNSGLVDAARADLRAAGDNLHALAINNSGIVRARTVSNAGGKIVLKAEEGTVVSNGTLDASGIKGGEVQVLGDKVGLTDLAKVDVSGETDAGTALIGGDFQGNNHYIKNADRTFVGRAATIKA